MVGSMGELLKECETLGDKEEIKALKAMRILRKIKVSLCGTR